MDDLVILHESARFVAADKPSGWLSVPSRWGAKDERPVLGRRLEERLGARLWPVHRIDEEASGLVLFARDPEAHAAASSWFEHRRVRKTYEALTECPEGGPPERIDTTWRSRLLRGKKRAYESPAGKESETRARLVGPVPSTDGALLLRWELEPVTGRPHQLRWEMARHGFPILGDELYGSRRSFRPGAIALRCVRLELPAEAEAFGAPLALQAPPLLDTASAARA